MNHHHVSSATPTSLFLLLLLFLACSVGFASRPISSAPASESHQPLAPNQEDLYQVVPVEPATINERRRLLSTIPSTLAGSFAIRPLISIASAGTSPTAATSTSTTISLPLEYVQALGGYVVHYYLFGERFGAIVDTGSPFLSVPATCSKWSYKYLWGCYKPELTQDSGYANTVEGFNSNQGTVVWRKAGFNFEENDAIKEVVFGVFGPALLDGPGGVFLGLIKETANWIRPSFLGQTDYQSFCVDLKKPNNTKLVLAEQQLIAPQDEDYIPLSADLYKKYKVPVLHYTAKAHSFVVNGLPLRLDERLPTYVIFDTGVTGMIVSQELFEGRNLQGRKNKEKSLWGQVTVSFLTKAGQEVQLSATKPITTSLGKANSFKRFKGNLIVLGLAFLDGQAMTIDIPQRKLKFD